MKSVTTAAALLLAATLSLTGCAMNGAGTAALNGCDWTGFILVSQKDVLTEDTAAQILTHNVTRERLCGKRE